MRTLTTLELAVELHKDLRELSFQDAEMRLAIHEALKALADDNPGKAERILREVSK